MDFAFQRRSRDESPLTAQSGQLSLSLDTGPQAYTVTELNASLQTIIRREFRQIAVAGEISSCRATTSGHTYFNLKDNQSQLKCALFKGNARYIKLKPRDGLSAIVRGNLEVYEARGEYQLIVESIEPQGDGALQLAFDQLKRRLSEEGLFENSRKRPLPKLPHRIGLITSPSGAVIKDMLHVLNRRFPGLHIRLYPALVQGDGSVEQVCRALDYFSRNDWAEVLILARGGGSLEDLWTFNEEAVARAIAACTVPVISAIGHETDFTIADFVADLRAPTPSAAAEQAVCTLQSLLDQISSVQARCLQAMRYKLLLSGREVHRRGIERGATEIHRAISKRSQRVDDADYRIRELNRVLVADKQRRLRELTRRVEANDLRIKLARTKERWKTLRERLQTANQQMLWKAQNRYAPQHAHLTQLSPLGVLGRGYAIVEKDNGQIVRSNEEVSVDDELSVRLGKGKIRTKVLTA